MTARRRNSLLISAGLGGIAATVVAVVLVLSTRAETVDLTTANLVPHDAGFYLALNSDLATSQWVDTFNLIERLGQEEPEAELRRSILEEGLVWDDDIAPFLGADAAFFLRSFDPMNGTFSGGAVLKAQDPEAALDVLLRQSPELDVTQGEYLGVEYLHDPAQDFSAAILGDHLVVAIGEESLRDVIDVFRGEQQSLASVEDFQVLRDELTRNFLGFVYLNTEVLMSDALADESLRALFEQASADFVLKPMAAVVGATSDGFTFQAASVVEAGETSPILAPRTSRYAGVVPADTSVFISTFGIGPALQDGIEAAEENLDESFGEYGYMDFGELFAGAGIDFGAYTLDDVIGIFEGETAVALWFPAADIDAPEGVLLTQVRDADAARDMIESLVPASEPRETLQHGGVEVSVVGSGSERLAYALDGSDLLIGTVEAVARTLDGGSSLAGAATYSETVAELPTALGTFAYFDLKALVRATEGGLPPEISRAEEALKGLIINLVQAKGTSGLSGVLTVQ